MYNFRMCKNLSTENRGKAVTVGGRLCEISEMTGTSEAIFNSNGRGFRAKDYSTM